MANALIISCFNLFETRIAPVYEELSKRYKVTVLTTDYSHTKKQHVDKHYEMCTYIHVPEYKKNLSIKRIISHLCFGKSVKKYIHNLSPELIYVCIPPNNVGKVCLDYKRKNPSVILIADLIDMWPEAFSKANKLPKVATLNWKKWRNDTLKHSDYVITECDYYVEVLEGVIDNTKTRTLYLYKKTSETYLDVVRNGIVKRTSLQENGEIQFAYLGSINNIIDIDGICGILQNAKNQGFHPVLHIIGKGNNQELFIDEAKGTGCEVVYHGAIFDDNEKARILSKCDYAFNMMRDYVKVGMTIKSMEYLSMGLPIINNIKGDTWKIVRNKHIGINIVDLNTPIDFYQEFDPNVILETFNNLFSINIFKSKISQIIEFVMNQER